VLYCTTACFVVWRSLLFYCCSYIGNDDPELFVRSSATATVEYSTAATRVVSRQQQQQATMSAAATSARFRSAMMSTADGLRRFGTAGARSRVALLLRSTHHGKAPPPPARRRFFATTTSSSAAPPTDPPLRPPSPSSSEAPAAASTVAAAGGGGGSTAPTTTTTTTELDEEDVVDGVGATAAAAASVPIRRRRSSGGAAAAATSSTASAAIAAVSELEREAERISKIALESQQRLLKQQQQQRIAVVGANEVDGGGGTLPDSEKRQHQQTAFEIAAGLLVASQSCTRDVLERYYYRSSCGSSTGTDNNKRGNECSTGTGTASGATTVLDRNQQQQQQQVSTMRSLHRSFVAVTSYCVNVLLISRRAEEGDNYGASASASNRAKHQRQHNKESENGGAASTAAAAALVRPVVELARRANDDLGLPFHLPLYERLLLAVAGHYSSGVAAGGGCASAAVDDLAEALLEIAAMARYGLDGGTKDSSRALASPGSVSSSGFDSKLLFPALKVLVEKRRRIDTLAHILTVLQRQYDSGSGGDDFGATATIFEESELAASLLLSVRDYTKRMLLDRTRSAPLQEEEILQCVRLLEPGTVLFLQRQQATDAHIEAMLRHMGAADVYDFLANLADPSSSNRPDDEDDDEGNLYVSLKGSGDATDQSDFVDPLDLAVDSILARGLSVEYKHQLLFELVRHREKLSETTALGACASHHDDPTAAIAKIMEDIIITFHQEDRDSGAVVDDDDATSDDDEDDDNWSTRTVQSDDDDDSDIKYWRSGSFLDEVDYELVYGRPVGDNASDDDKLRFPDVTDQLSRLSGGLPLQLTPIYEEVLLLRAYGHNEFGSDAAHSADAIILFDDDDSDDDDGD